MKYSIPKLFQKETLCNVVSEILFQVASRSLEMITTNNEINRINDELRKHLNYEGIFPSTMR